MSRTSVAFTIRLPANEKRTLAALLRRGSVNARVITRAHILRQLAKGHSPPAIAENLSVCANTVRNVARRYISEGLDAALFDLPRPGQPELLDTKQKQQIIAMVCSAPPPDRARWTLHLIVEEACKARIVASISHETVRRLLQEHDLQPWREKNVVHWGNYSRISSPDGRRPGDV